MCPNILFLALPSRKIFFKNLIQCPAKIIVTALKAMKLFEEKLQSFFPASYFSDALRCPCFRFSRLPSNNGQKHFHWKWKPRFSWTLLTTENKAWREASENRDKAWQLFSSVLSFWFLMHFSGEQQTLLSWKRISFVCEFTWVFLMDLNVLYLRIG